MLRSNWTWGVLLCIFAFLCGQADVRAQTYGSDYLSFQGVLAILDNPTSAACQSHQIYFGNEYRITYRFTANPNVIADAFVIVGGGEAARMVSTQQPSFSLAGPATTTWNYIDGYGNSDSNIASSSNLTIPSGLGAPISLATGNLKILGSINNFLAWPDCNISSVHGAAVAKPN